jgi:hypothetical protein
MRQILEIEDHVVVPPMMYSDPFYRITHLIKEEIRKYKWIEGERGRVLSWAEARAEWTEAHREKYEKFLVETLSFPESAPEGVEEMESSPEQAGKSPEAQDLVKTGAMLSNLPHRTGG